MTIDHLQTFILATTKEQEYFEDKREKNFTVAAENIFLRKVDTYLKFSTEGLKRKLH